MPEPSDLDRTAVRRQFDRRARDDGADFLLREVEGRMLERLDLIRLSPGRVLDVGCGLGQGSRRLRARWPQAQVVGLDLSQSRVARAAQLDRPAAQGWLQSMARRLTPARTPAPQSSVSWVVGDAHSLPLASESVDLVWSNGVLHWFDDVPAALAEWRRVIRPDGLLMFTALGVDTLTELRTAGAGPMTGLPDMHDIGDALLAAGFAEPVMDTERLTVTWQDPAIMLRELRALGGDARRSRPPGLATPRRRAAALRALAERAAASGGPLAVTFEVIHGHAWRGRPKADAQDWAPLEFRPSRPRSGV